MKKLLVVLAIAAITLMAGSAMAAGVNGTAHDLRDGLGTGSVEICVFCHTPHSSDALKTAPLWSHTTATNGGYTPYTSPTMDATMTANLSTVSLACMSCHDGTVALGSIAYGRYAGTTYTVPTYGAGAMGAVTANFGTDLSNDHPVSIQLPAADTNIDSAANITTAGLSLFGVGADVVECGSCHAVHDNTIAPFLRMTMAASQLCTTCHLNH